MQCGKKYIKNTTVAKITFSFKDNMFTGLVTTSTPFTQRERERKSIIRTVVTKETLWNKSCKSYAYYEREKYVRSKEAFSPNKRERILIRPFLIPFCGRETSFGLLRSFPAI